MPLYLRIPSERIGFTLKVFEDELYINDDSKVIISDIFADNGVIHVVDTVILGPWPRAE